MLNEQQDRLFGKTTLIACILIVMMALLVSCYIYNWSDSASPALSGNDDNDDVTDDDVTDDDDTSGEDVWTDSTSGLMWQVEPTGGTMDWASAKSHCPVLSLGGHDDWRLPTISELRSLIRGCDDTETGGSCGVTDECLNYSGCRNDPCNGCSGGGGPAGGCYWPSQMNGECSWFWSSSPVADGGDGAWGVDFYSGYVGDSDYAGYGDGAARCVRP